MPRIAIAAAVGLAVGGGAVGGYFVAQERICAVLDIATQATFDDASAALASVVADPDGYVVTRDYLDLRDNIHHTEFGFFEDGELVEEVNIYEATAGSWSVFSMKSCEGPTMP